MAWTVTIQFYNHVPLRGELASLHMYFCWMDDAYQIHRKDFGSQRQEETFGSLSRSQTLKNSMSQDGTQDRKSVRWLLYPPQKKDGSDANHKFISFYLVKISCPYWHSLS